MYFIVIIQTLAPLIISAVEVEKMRRTTMIKRSRTSLVVVKSVFVNLAFQNISDEASVETIFRVPLFVTSFLP